MKKSYFFKLGKYLSLEPGTGTSPTLPGILCLNPLVDEPAVGRPYLGSRKLSFN